MRQKLAAVGVTLLTAAGLVTATAPTAHAEGRYNIRIDTYAWFVADYCLLSTTSGNARAACSGNKGSDSSFRLGVVHNAGDRVWIDVNIVGGADRKGIDLRGKRYLRIWGTTGTLKVCGWDSLAAWEASQPGVDLHGVDTC